MTKIGANDGARPAISRAHVVIAVIVLAWALALVVLIRPTHELPPAPAELPAAK